MVFIKELQLLIWGERNDFQKGRRWSKWKEMLEFYKVLIIQSLTYPKSYFIKRVGINYDQELDGNH